MQDAAGATAANLRSGAVPPRPASTPRAGASLVTNAAANIVGQLVFIAAGFVLPRIISDHLGKHLLGVWDFGWSLVAHLMLIDGGVLSAVSRDVARFTSTGEVIELRKLITSCLVLLSGCGLAAAAVTVGISAALPEFLPSLDPEALPQARWVTLLLGLSVTVRLVLHVFNGIITGNQRYVLHNFINSGAYLAIVVTNIAMLLSGFGLVAMAATYLAGELLAGLAKLYFARRLCPDWRIGRQYLSRPMMVHVVRFGGKTVFQAASRVLLYQSNSLLVGRMMGVESLAEFSRSRSLVQAVERMFAKAALVFAPRASADHARGDHDSLRRLVLAGSEYSLMLALPIILTLCFLGDAILRVWMGAAFAFGAVLAIMAGGHLMAFAQRSTYHVTLGMGKHGAPALAEFLGAVSGCLLTVLFVGPMKLGLVGAALGIAIPLTVTNGVFMPAYAAKVLNIPASELLLAAFWRPLLYSLPVIVIYSVGLWIAFPSPLVALAVQVPLAAGAYALIALPRLRRRGRGGAPGRVAP